jgi:hypothetical protein
VVLVLIGPAEATMRRSVALLILASACAGDPGVIRQPPADSGAPTETDTDADSDTDSDADTDTDTDTDTDADADTEPTGPCPVDMSIVSGTFCIDRYEGALEEQVGGTWIPSSPYETVDGRTVRAVPANGAVPQGYISGDEADEACENAGKRLCTADEWLEACEGPDETTWPYGDTHQDGACNDDYPGSHPVVDYFGTSDDVWDSEHMNDPGINQQADTVALGGAFSACESAWGVFDLHGNLHEWIADSDGTFRGGFYADAEINGDGCGYTTTAHSTSYHDYSTGFRCCADKE